MSAAIAALGISAAAHAQDPSFWYRHKVSGITTSDASVTPGHSGPSIALASSSVSVITGVTTRIFQGAAVTGSDASDVLTATFTWDTAGVGNLSFSTFTPQATGTLTLTATPAVITTALGTIQYRIPNGSLTPGSSRSLDFGLQVTDEGGTSDAATVTLTVTEPLDSQAPAIAGIPSNLSPLPGQAISPFSTAEITHPNDDNVTIRVSIDDLAPGTFTARAGFTNLGTRILQTTSSPATVTAALQAMVYTVAEGRLDPGETESVVFTVVAEDSLGLSSTTMTTLTITAPPNDPPIISGLPPGLTVDADATISPFAAASISDAEDDIVTVTVTLDDIPKGSFSTLSAFVDVGDGSYIAADTPATLTAALQGMVFTPADLGLLPGDSTSVQITLEAEDTYGTATPSTMTLTISAPVNEPPVIAGMPSGLAVEVGQTTAPFAAMSVSDPENDSVTLSFSLDDPAKGSLSSLGGFTNSGGLYTLSAAPAAVTSALRAVVFTPATGRLEPEESETASFTITAADAHDFDTATVSVTISAPANLPPAIPGIPSGLTVEVGSTIPPFAALSVSDPENDTVTVTVALDDPAKGSFSSLGSFTSSGPGSYAISTSPAAATSALRAIVFSPADGRLDPETSESVSFTITAADAYDFDSQTFSITVTAPAEPAAPSGGCDGNPEIGTICDDGAIYVGVSGGHRIFAAPTDSPDMYWGDEMSVKFGGQMTSQSDGLYNTNVIHSSGGDMSGSAIRYCRNLGTGWYAPAIEELELLYQRYLTHNHIFNFNSMFMSYWSSSLDRFPDGWFEPVVYAMDFTRGPTRFIIEPMDNIAVRCVRR